MKILLLTEWFHPEPDLKGLPFARELQKKGHKVQVLTTFPNYPSGRVYRGYKIKCIQREIIDGVEIIRVPVFPSHDTSAFKRILTYLSFAFFASIIGVFAVKKADIMYVYHPPATVTLPALIIKFFRRIPIVYDIQDIWPDSLKHSGMVKEGSFILKFMNWYGNISYKLVDKIVVLSNGFKKLLIERGVPEKKITVIHNWANDIPLPKDDFDRDQKRAVLKFDDKFVVLYAGNMGPGQAMSSVLSALAVIKDTHPQVMLALIGGGIEVDHLKKLQKELNLTNVMFLERVQPAQIGEILLAGDILLVHLKSDKLSDITIPSKTQAYLLVGQPILIGVKGEASEMVQKANAGLVCESENPQDIAQKIIEASEMDKTILQQMGKNGKIFYDNNLSISLGSEKFIEIFGNIATTKP